MKDFSKSTYGDRIAEVYDEIYGSLSSPEQVDPMVDVLEELAAGGRALELGIGTGRIALPLAARGIDVHGIDASESMVAKMRRKSGAPRYPSHWATSRMCTPMGIFPSYTSCSTPSSVC